MKHFLALQYLFFSHFILKCENPMNQTRICLATVLKFEFGTSGKMLYSHFCGTGTDYDWHNDPCSPK